MSKAKGAYAGAAKKKGKAKAGKKRQATVRSVEVATSPLFSQAGVVREFATLVLAAHEGPAAEKEILRNFLDKMDNVQASIKAACASLQQGGNPMYRTFTIRS